MLSLTRSQATLKENKSTLDLKTEEIYKSGMRIKVIGFVVSGFSKKYYSYAFFGEVLEHDGLKKEYCLGDCEQSKDEDFINPESVHVTRFSDKRGLAAFFNQGIDYLKQGK